MFVAQVLNSRALSVMLEICGGLKGYISSCMKNTAMQIENDMLLASGRVSAVQAPVSIC